jgi:hypothetical protein
MARIESRFQDVALQMYLSGHNESVTVPLFAGLLLFQTKKFRNN